MMHQSIQAAPSSPPPAPGYCGPVAGLVSLGGGAFANFVLPGGRAFANPWATPELLSRTLFPIRKKITQMILLGKKADWLICHGQEKIEEVVKACS